MNHLASPARDCSRAKLGLENKLKLQEIADNIGRSRATIQTWFDLFRNEGIERLCRRSHAQMGRPSLLTPAAQKALRKKLAKGSFRRVDDARVVSISVKQSHGTQ